MFNYFKYIELKYKYQLSKNKPIVVRFDGKNITKSNTYDLSTKNQFTNALLLTAEHLVRKFNDCIAYVAIDEINLIFVNPKEFFDYYTDNSDSLQYCLSVVQQDFLSIFWKSCPDIFFGVSIFNIPNDKVDSYLKYRKSSAYNVAVTYFAKRNLDKIKYINKKLNEILAEIKKENLFDKFKDYPHSAKGTLINQKYLEEKDDKYDELILSDFF